MQIERGGNNDDYNNNSNNWHLLVAYHKLDIGAKVFIDIILFNSPNNFMMVGIINSFL